MRQPIRALVSDCDGVLVDSEIVAQQVLLEALHGRAPREELAAFLHEGFGMSTVALLHALQQRFGFFLPEGFAAEMRDRTERLLASRVEPIPFAREAMEAIELPLAIVSNSQLHCVTASVRRAGLERRAAGRIFGADQVAAPKPAPDLYLLAARELGVPPGQCLAIEDSTAGVQAALAAGTQVIGFVGASHIPATHATHLQQRLGVVAVVADMRELPALVRELVARRAGTDGAASAPAAPLAGGLA